MSHALLNSIHDLIARRRLLDHPFYQAWSHGALTPDDLRMYGAQYYHWVMAFPTWISATHANATDLEMRQSLVKNLSDEEMGDRNHPELWLRFTDALGLPRETVRRVELLPETAEAIAMMRQVCREQPAVAGVAALYAYESQQPAVMKTKREGLQDLYSVQSGHDYFVEHETADVAHSAEELALVEQHAAGHEQAILSAAQTALDATYKILDGIEKRRQSVN